MIYNFFRCLIFFLYFLVVLSIFVTFMIVTFYHFFLFVDLFVVSLTSWPSGGLMRDVPRRLGYLNTWSSFRGAVWEDWGGVSALDGGRMRVHRLAPLPVLSCFLPPAPASCSCLLPPCLSLAACLPVMMAFTLGIKWIRISWCGPGILSQQLKC